MRKLAIITHEYHPVLCGGTILVDKLGQCLSGLNYNIEVLTTGIGKGFPKVETNGHFVVRRFYTGRTSIGDAKFREHILFFVFGFPQIFAYLLRTKFDLLFCIFAIPCGFLGTIISKMLRIPSVVFVDAADMPGVQSAMKKVTDRLKPLFKYVTKNSSAVTMCDGLQDISEPLIKNKNTAIIPCGTIIPARTANPGGSSTSAVNFLTIGRLVLRKGFVEIIQAFALVRKQEANFRLTIVGYGRDEEYISQVVSENNLEEHITMAGRVEYEELENYYVNSDCYIFFGDREGPSQAMTEAVSYGLPIIATDDPGTTTYVRNGLNGFLVKHKDVQELSEAILEIIHHKDALPLWGKNSRTLASDYTWDKIAAQYDQVFSSVLENYQDEGRDRPSNAL